MLLRSRWHWPCVVAVLAGAAHVLVGHLLDGLAKTHYQLKDVPQSDNPRETSSIGRVPDQRERGRLFDDHSLNALVQCQLVVQHDYLGVIRQ